ncbi:MAG: acetate--CoA ligase family protein [Candidatus ainarchaeum sp.]|nr:acetate--CoA ligase family protein [Candidatus ainarchaeum sp.]
MAFLNLKDSFDFLNKNNINTLAYTLISSKKDLKNFKEYPYVLKLSSSLLHKTEKKVVFVNLNNKKDLENSYDSLKKVIFNEKIKKYDILLQKQIPGIEIIIGIKEDKQFGKVILFGFGGIFTEVFKDSSIKILPISKKDLNFLFSETKIGSILEKGFRNKKYPIKELKEMIYNISNLAIKYNIKELDINPLIINENGLYIVDSRILL